MDTRCSRRERSKTDAIALNRYLEMNPDAKDAGLVRFTLAQ